MIIVIQNIRENVFKSAPLEYHKIKSLLLKITLLYQHHQFFNEPCIEILVLSRSLTCYIEYVFVNNHSSANTNKTRNLIMTYSLN